MFQVTWLSVQSRVMRCALYVRLLLGAVVMNSVMLAELIVALAGMDERSNFTRMRLFWLPLWLATWIVVAVPKFVVAAPCESWLSPVDGWSVTVMAPAGEASASAAANRQNATMSLLAGSCWRRKCVTSSFPYGKGSARSSGRRRGQVPGVRPESGRRSGAGVTRSWRRWRGSGGRAPRPRAKPVRQRPVHRSWRFLHLCDRNAPAAAGARAGALASAAMMTRVTAPTRWPEARATRGMVAAPHVLAAEAGRAMFTAGGNALDAAIAAAATIAVVYPHMNSIGGDNFWLIYEARAGRLRALNACGRAAPAVAADAYRARYGTAMPVHGGAATMTLPQVLSA